MTLSTLINTTQRSGLSAQKTSSLQDGALMLPYGNDLRILVGSFAFDSR